MILKASNKSQNLRSLKFFQKHRSVGNLVFKIEFRTLSVFDCQICIQHKLGCSHLLSLPHHSRRVCEITSVLISKNQSRKFPPYAPHWPTGFTVCRKIHMGARRLPAFTITGSWALSFSVERTFTAHVSAQLSVTHCFSALCSSKKEMGKGENSEVHHITVQKTELKRNNTTKENWKGRNWMCPSHWKKQSVCFYYLSHFYFTFCDLGEKKKKKIRSQLSSSYHCGFYGCRSEWCDHRKSWPRELEGLWVHILSTFWSFKILEDF